MPDAAPPAPPRRPAIGVSVACWRAGEVLVVQRGRPPLQGMWSLPGGHVEYGEAIRAAAARELSEETGIEADIVGIVDALDVMVPRPGAAAAEPPAHHFVLAVFAARWRTGEPVAGDDAAVALFLAPDAALALDLTPGAADVIRASRGLVGDAG
jgi:8-oxo-dGTP diphosphatase